MGEPTTSISLQDLSLLIGSPACPAVFDVRRREVFETATDMIPSAAWRDPAGVEAWGRVIPAGAEVIVYCVHGHEVSQGVAAALRRLGRRAVYLEGGIEGYRAAGGVPVARPDRAD